MIELKVCKSNKVRFSPHQILFHTQKSKRNFLLINHTPPRLPSSIKLYESKQIINLIKGIDKALPLAVDDWALIQNKLIGIKNN